MRTKQVLLIMFLLVVTLEFHTIYAADTLDEYQQAILDTAKAFYYRGDYIDYDSCAMNYYGDSVYASPNIPYMQRNYLLTKLSKTIPKDLDWMYKPEEATRQNRRYLVCSHFVHNVFYQAFEDDNGNHYILKDNDGNIANITKYMCPVDEGDTPYNSDIFIYSFKRDENTSEEEIEANKNELLKRIQPGDVIIYCTGTTGGHTGIYCGNNLMYESAGDKCDIIAKKDEINATVKRESTPEGFINGGLDQSDIKHVVLLRPLNEIKSQGYHISSDTYYRMQYPDLVIEKIASVERYESVNPGDKITYSIILTNKSTTTDYSNIKAFDWIPVNTEFVSIDPLGRKVIDDEFVFWNNIDIGKGDTVTLEYTVKVNDMSSLIGETIFNDKTHVNNIKINSIQTKVNRTLTEEEQTKISSVALNKGKSYTSTATFLNEVYKNVNFKEADQMLEMFFTSEKIDIEKVLLGKKWKNKTVYQLKELSSVNGYYARMYVDDLWGGFYTLGLEKETNDDGRKVYFDERSFMIGDVLVLADEDYKNDTYVAGEKNMYLYIAKNKFATVDNGELRIIENDEAKRLIDSLISQDCFIVLRASYAMMNYQVGNEYFSTFAEAVNAIEKEGTIKVLNTVEDYSDFVIGTEQNIVLDTNGQKIYLRKSPIGNNGTLKIKGNGRLETDLDYLITNYGNIIVDGPVLVTNGMSSTNWYTIFSKGGTVTVLNGNIGAKGTESGEGTSNGRAIGLKDGAILTVKGGQVKSYIGYAITSISSQLGSAGSEINIEGGEISGLYGVHLSTTGNYQVKTKVKMTGGSIQTTNHAFDIKENTDCTVIIEGGTIVSKNQTGINNEGNGTVKIGKDDINVLKLPTITGEQYGINSKTGFDFYDGLLKGKEAAYVGTVNNEVEGHELYNGVDGDYKTLCWEKKLTLRGDVNMDGSVNSTDLQRLYSHLNGSNKITNAQQLLIADVNEDGHINSTDLQRLYSHLNGSNPL